MTPEEEREAARKDPRQLELPLETLYRTEIDWKVGLLYLDPELAKYIVGKSPIIHVFNRDMHPIRFEA